MNLGVVIVIAYLNRLMSKGYIRTGRFNNKTLLTLCTYLVMSYI